VLCGFFWFFLVVYFDHLVSFLCCVFVFVFGGSILLILLVFCAFRFLGGGGSMLVILLVFCLVCVFCLLFFWGGRAVNVAHLVNFLCCVFFIVWGGASILLILLVFCVVFLGGSMLLILLVFRVVFFCLEGEGGYLCCSSC
jgi:hypothetical protein